MINLSRNVPASFIVGVAGFLGSHLAEKLLAKGIQVIGIDDLSSGDLSNLSQIQNDKNFHFINQSAEEKFPVGFNRLDYSFFILSDEIKDKSFLTAFENFLSIHKNYHSKIVLVSHINLYDESLENLKVLREAERLLAKYTVENNANARVIRVAAIYGPRMHFREKDPMIRLIESDVSGNLTKDLTPLDFTSRAIYIDDAVDLLIKAVFHGATAQKIYDGALSNPVKVTEIKQILLDPLWYENRGYQPTELPPWPTPNLLKTQKELSWKARTPLVTALRQTIKYFKDTPGAIKEKEKKEVKDEAVKEPVQSIHPEKRSGFNNYQNYVGDRWGTKLNEEDQNEKKKKSIGLWKNFEGILVATLIFYALIFPFIKVGFGAFLINSNLRESNQALSQGNLTLAYDKLQRAQKEAHSISETFNSVDFVNSIPLLQPYWKALNNWSGLLTLATEVPTHAVSGTQALVEGLKIISGEGEGELKITFEKANAEFVAAESKLSRLKSQTINNQQSFFIPTSIGANQKEVLAKINLYQEMVNSGKVVGLTLSQAIAGDDNKKYLVLLLDNTKIRAGGGVIESYALVEFNKGKLVNIKTGDAAEFNQSVKGKVEPPFEIKTDLGKTSWVFQDSNVDLDFPSNARWAKWFYEREVEDRINGVVALDLSSLARVLEVVGPLNLPEGGGSINKENLIAKVEDPSKDKFLPTVLKEFLNRMFFISQNDWPAVLKTFSQLIEEKHFMVYVADPTLFSYLSAEGWTGTMPKMNIEKIGERQEFLAWAESNIGGNSVNQYIGRDFHLESEIKKSGEVSHHLAVSYTNKNISEAISVGRYRFRVKVYLPMGNKLLGVKWGEKDVYKEVSSFSDYGWAGYSLILDLKPNEQKSLVLDYQNLKPLQFDKEGLIYKLDILKQPGRDKDSLKFNLNYPASYKLVSSESDAQSSGLMTYTTDLSQDRSFEIVVRKSL